MARIKKEFFFEESIEVEECVPLDYGAKGMPRMKRKKATPEQVKKQNQYNREKNMRRLLKWNFKENDYWITYTYRKEERPPDMTAALKDKEKMLEKLRREYRKRGEKLTWIMTIEIGIRGAIHIHLVANRIKGEDTDIILKKVWEKGGIFMTLLYEQGGFRKLADYIVKQPDEENKLKETNHSRSRNMIIKEPKKKTYKRKKWPEAKPRKGYYIDRESFVEGVNPVTGHQYRHYTMIRLNRRI